MSLAEMQLRREKGLCFTCDEKFTPSYRCPNKQYLWLRLDEEDDFSDQANIFVKSAVEDTQPVCEPHLSFNALKGSTGVGIMGFQGLINGLPIQILLDSGSSDNLLQLRIANYLKLPIEPIYNFNVLVGNGSTLVVEGFIKDLEVTIQSHSLILPVYLLPISGADLVLGASWLATLVAHISDYSTLTLFFDDILVYSPSWLTHLQHLEMVL
uniref:Uncharacterized protein n=1 Tax=Cajanus cajan TaxID=3821 RepID=A0A151SGE2_CAJCA|nr:hypothetical protein KK1_000018 [Cajanus cajan]